MKDQLPSTADLTPLQRLVLELIVHDRHYFGGQLDADMTRQNGHDLIPVPRKEADHAEGI